LILTYHELGHETSSDLYRVSIGQFESHLRLLDNLSSQLRVNYKDYSITFDDGHISHYNLAFPVLTKDMIRCTFFITTEWIGSSERMSKQHIRYLVEAGHRVGSHSCSHPFLPNCSDEQLRYEVGISKEKLQDTIGSEVTTISVPYGRWDNRVLRACREAGYTWVYTSDPWLTAAEREGVMCCGRLTVRNSFSAHHLQALLTARGLAKARLQAPFMAKQALKACIGDRIYHRLWQVLAHRDTSDVPNLGRQR
jgi:peptidoglycan/xylan/chitin deacetylase (PgdA/CDA1 family)